LRCLSGERTKSERRISKIRSTRRRGNIASRALGLEVEIEIWGVSVGTEVAADQMLMLTVASHLRANTEVILVEDVMIAVSADTATLTDMMSDAAVEMIITLTGTGVMKKGETTTTNTHTHTSVTATSLDATTEISVMTTEAAVVVVETLRIRMSLARNHWGQT
jgi:hypothetical protein